MNALQKLLCSLSASLSLATFKVDAAVDPGAFIVQLQTSCTGSPGEVLDNCFTSSAALTTWITGTRKPNEASPLQVNIGPGTFDRFDIVCDPAGGFTGHISFMGAGRQHTVFGAPTGAGLSVGSCDQMSFSHLKVHAYNSSGSGVTWSGGGSSRWQDVDIDAQYYGWNEAASACGSQKGQHYWFGSRIITKDKFSAAVAYRAVCDESWFFGSEIAMDLVCQDGVVPTGNAIAVAAVGASAEIHVYGSVLRTLASCTLRSGMSLLAAYAGSGGKIHIHGTGIDVISSVPNNIKALSASSASSIHANTTSYNLSTPSGTVTRVPAGGHNVHAPYFWEGHETPPNIITQDGADMAAVTSPTDPPRLVISSQVCDSKWFDVGANVCWQAAP
jgi:hypothetical protein